MKIKLDNVVGIPKGKIIVEYKGKIFNAKILDKLIKPENL